MGSDSRRLKVVIPGGTGQVGSILARAFHGDGHEVVVLSRKPKVAPWRVVAWDARSLGDWAGEVEGADVIVNLAGRTVNCRYTPANRRLIRESRVDSTRVVGEAIARAARPPRAWLQAGTATIYSHRHDAPNDEETGILGGSEPNTPDTWRFSVEVATAWERAMDEFVVRHTRKVVLRSAMTMSPRLRCVPGARPSRTRGMVRRRRAIRLVGPRRRLRPCDLLADRERGGRGSGQHRLARAAAQRPIHAGPPRGGGHPLRAPGGGVDARSRGEAAGDRDRVDPQE